MKMTEEPGRIKEMMIDDDRHGHTYPNEYMVILLFQAHPINLIISCNH